jgi:dynein intermediate chain 2
MWWDIRKLRLPTEILLFDLDEPNEQQIDRAVGISSLDFEPTASTKFIFGLQNGIVISGLRKAKTPAEKLALRFKAHFGPVNAINRNSFNPKIFLTVGDSKVRIWAEDYKEDNLMLTRYLFYVRNDASEPTRIRIPEFNFEQFRKKDVSRLDRSDRLCLFRSLLRYLSLLCLKLMLNKSYKSR